MSKAVLVMNMPKNCLECPIGKNMSNAMEVCIKCPFGRCAIDEETKTIPSWCPLKEVPKKKSANNSLNVFKDGSVYGYNACIDDILEDRENEVN